MKLNVWFMLLLPFALMDAAGCAPTESVVESAQPAAPEPQGLGRYEALCVEAAQLFCAGNQKCCQAERFRYPDYETCVDDQLPNCRILLLVEALETGALVLNMELLEKETAVLRQAAQTCSEVASYEMEEMFLPTVDLNGSCSGTRDLSGMASCRSGLFCQVTHAEAEGYRFTGTCQSLRTRGQSCRQHSDFLSYSPCVDGLVCLGETGTCEPARPSGASCVRDADCEGEWGRCQDGLCSSPTPAASSPAPGYFCGGRRQDACTSSSAERTGEVECRTRFDCGEYKYGAKCTQGEDGWLCACTRNAETLHSFRSTRLCDLDEPARAAALEAECGFQLVY